MFEKRRFPWHIPVIAIIGILVLASGVYIGLKSGNNNDKTTELVSKIDKTNKESAMDISEECEIWVVEKYPDGTPVKEDGGTMVGTIPKNLIGKSKNDISKYLLNEYPNRKIEKMSKYEITLVETISEQPQAKGEYSIEELDGYIVVYKHGKNNEKEILEKTDIHLNSLPKSSQDEIKQGIFVNSEDEAYSKLEDFGS
jgi:hypothetical protein